MFNPGTCNNSGSMSQTATYAKTFGLVIYLVFLLHGIVHGQLTGIKTIKSSGGDYASFTAAINALNTSGVGAGGVTFHVDAGFTITENPPVITTLTGSAANPVVFQKSGTGSNPVITATGTGGTTDAVIAIRGCDYFTFDGIDIAVSGTAVEFGYYIYNNSATNGATNNTIKNCNIILDKTNTASKGIYQYVPNIPSSAAGANSTNKYYNLTIENCNTGIMLNGDGTYPDLNCEIGTTGSGTCTIGGAVADNLTAAGINATDQSSVKIFNTEVRNVGSTFCYGIFLGNGQGTSLIYNNKIHDIRNNNTTSTGGIYGLYLFLSSTGTTAVNAYNNFVYNITSLYNVGDNATKQIVGILVTGGGSTSQTYNVCYNNVRIDGNVKVVSVCYQLSGVAAVIKTQNNVFANFTGAQTTVAKHYCFYTSTANSVGAAGSVSNYNDFYVNNTTNGYVGLDAATDRATFANWKSLTCSPDVNSKNVDPSFTSSTDLHTANATLVDAGTDLVTITTTDIDGDDRSSGTDDIGADEQFVFDVTSKVIDPVSQVSAGDINSTAVSIGLAVSVFKFKISDLATSDAVSTKVTCVKIKKSSGTADLTDHIADAGLWEGVTQITTGAAVITDADITFPVTSGNLDITNGGNREITLKVWLNTTNIIDNSTMVFYVGQASHGFTSHSSGSAFNPDFGAAVTGNTMTVRVTATKLIFTTQPQASVYATQNLSPQPVVKAVDANNNVDVSISDNVTVTNSGSIGMSNLPASFSAGVCTFPAGFQFTSSGTVTITVAENPSTGLTDAMSSSVTVNPAPPDTWAESYTGTGANDDNAYAIAGDAANNVYIAGGFRTTVDADPGAGTNNLTVSGSTQAAFFSKYNKFGELLWAKKINSASGENIIQGIAVDVSGNVYVAGEFQGNDFDVDLSGTVTAGDLSSAGGNDIFFAKYNSSGVYQWAYKIGNTGSDIGYGICVDGNSNIYITGHFNGSMDFDPGGGTNTLNSGSQQYAFLASYTSAGTHRWAYGYGSSTANADAYAYHVKPDAASNNVFVCGSFEATVDFDPVGTCNLSSTGAGDRDGFVAKYSTAAGAFQWAFSIGGGGTATDEVTGISLDAGDNVYITGEMMTGTVDFDPSPSKAVANLTLKGVTDVFFAKYTSGSVYSWANNIGTAGNNVHVFDIINEGTSIYIAGYFSNTIDFDPGAGTENQTAAGTTDLFLAQYASSDGSFECKNNIGSSGNNVAKALAGGNGYVYAAGWFNGVNVDFDPDPAATALLSSGGSSDIFFASFKPTSGGAGCLITLPVSLISFTSKCAGAYIEINWKTSAEINNDFFELERTTDLIRWEHVSRVEGAGNSNKILKYNVHDNFYPDGTVYYRLKQTDFDGTSTYSRIITSSCFSEIRICSESLDCEISYGHKSVIISFWSGCTGLYNIELMDCTGRELSVKNIYLEKGNRETVSLDLVYPAGIYFLRVGNNISSVTKKIIIQ